MNSYEAALNDSILSEGVPLDWQTDLMSFVEVGNRVGGFMLFSAGLSLIPLGLK